MRQIALLIFCSLFAAGPAAAEPGRGFLSGKNDFIQFDCKSTGSKELQCDFVQVSFHSSSKPEGLKTKLDDAEELISTFFSEEASQFCAFFSEEAVSELDTLVQSRDRLGMTRFLESMSESHGGDSSRAEKVVEEAHPRQLDDMLAYLHALAYLCVEQTLEAAERLIRLEFEQEARTCELLINPWTDTFEKVSDTLWSIKSPGPRGECGIVRLDRFECERDYASMCNFVSEKRVLNKDGGALIPCNGLDEQPYDYTWNSEPMYLDCDIIEYP